MTSKPGPDEAIAALERIVAHEVGRGSEQLARHTAGGLRRAAESLATQARPQVLILTGFFIPSADPPACETDGPIGAVQLAAAIAALGGQARIVTDQPCAPVLAAAISATDQSIPLDVVPLPDPADPSGFEEQLRALRDRYRAMTHLVAVERVGPSEDGPPRNMRGVDISAHTAPLHRLYEPGPWIRIGIGDGGNELGMGALPRDVIAQVVVHGEAIRCVVACDALIVGGTSNWGTAGLVAALAVHSPRHRHKLSLLLEPEWSKQVLETIVAEGGAVDGVSRQRTTSVDGLTWQDYAAVLAEVRQVVERLSEVTG